MSLPERKEASFALENQWDWKINFGSRPVFRGELAVSFRECLVVVGREQEKGVPKRE